ncbi:DUF47 family protein, partial [bacterium]|nr:DUF47 family protein [bacterium]MBU1635095.1 DUF47 family protein [bacterium]
QLNILNARAEVNRMGDVIEKMYKTALGALLQPKNKIPDIVDEIKELEELSDQMQEEISKYLVNCYQDDLSEKNVKVVNAMMRVVHELESIGDSIYNLVILIKRKTDKSIEFDSKAEEELLQYTNLIRDFIEMFKNHLTKKFDSYELENAYTLENQVNTLRYSLSKAARKRLQKGSNVRAELLFMDMVQCFESIGDNSLNIAQALRQMGND